MKVLTSQLQFTYVKELGNPFFDLFPHRFDYIFAPHPEPHTSPNWQTESRHPLTDRLLDQGRFLYGVRFGVKTQYSVLDIDAGSPYHPASDPFAIQRILAVLEAIGLVRYLAVTSSDSGGLHLYFPLHSPQNSWELGAAITILLSNAGFTVKPGCLEIFPNRKTFSIQGKPSLFNAHRLPLQMGSYLLNSDFQPIWGDRQTFIQQWQICQAQNLASAKAIQQTLKQNCQQHRRISGKAAKFLNDLNTEIELGWTGPGQTNYLLGRITMRAYIFHHVLTGEAPLVGQALIDAIVETARSLPGYQEWCNHQHEIEHRATEWARCVESSRYFQYGIEISKTDRSIAGDQSKPLSWNQQQAQNTRDRIKQAIADLLNQNQLPIQTTDRFKALTAYGIGGGSLYRHKDLWHPEFLTFDPEKNCLNFENLDFKALEESNPIDLNFSQSDRSIYETSFKEKTIDQHRTPDSLDLYINQSTNCSQSLTSLFTSLGCNPLIDAPSGRSIFSIFHLIDRNALLNLGFVDLDQLLHDWAIDVHCNDQTDANGSVFPQRITEENDRWVWDRLADRADDQWDSPPSFKPP